MSAPRPRHARATPAPPQAKIAYSLRHARASVLFPPVPTPFSCCCPPPSCSGACFRREDSCERRCVGSVVLVHRQNAGRATGRKIYHIRHLFDRNQRGRPRDPGPGMGASGGEMTEDECGWAGIEGKWRGKIPREQGKVLLCHFMYVHDLICPVAIEHSVVPKIVSSQRAGQPTSDWCCRPAATPRSGAHEVGYLAKCRF
eukprot:gene8924-biopygen4666